jgi:hypothetical protein
MRLTRATNGCAMLVTCVPKPRSLVPGSIREAEAYLHAVRASLEEQEGVMFEECVLKGDPASEITRAAHKFEVDLVILVTRGRRGWDKMMLGSVAESVLTHCRAPIVLLNEATHQIRSDEEVQRQSVYLAGVIWNRKLRGLCSEEEALEELERIANAGLDRDLLVSTYQQLASAGSSSDLLDIEFQMNTLRKFMPGEVAGLTSPEEAA